MQIVFEILGKEYKFEGFTGYIVTLAWLLGMYVTVRVAYIFAVKLTDWLFSLWK